MDLALRLILAHFAGDFLFQPTKWIEDRQARKWRSKYLYYHFGVHALLFLFAFYADVRYWVGYSVIVISHLFIDIAKAAFSGKIAKAPLFFMDQFLHLLIVLIFVQYYHPVQLAFVSRERILLGAVALLMVTQVASIIVKMVIAKWNDGGSSTQPDPEEPSLEKAGTYIGILERLFVFGFVVTGHWEGIGFLLAAKSVFRFGDLSNAKDRSRTEYILIGTLLSFGLAMLTGMIFLFFLTKVP